MQDQSLSLEIIFEDVHLIELRARVAYAGWSAETRACTSLNDLRAAIDDVARFGERLSGSACLEAGQENMGLVSLRFYTYGGAKHLACDVRMLLPTDMSCYAGEACCPQEP